MQRDDKRVILFAAVVCVACSLLLSGTAALLRKRQDFNVEMDRKVNVLKAFGVEVTNTKGKRIISDEEALATFTDHISEIVIEGETGRVLEGITSADLTSDERKQKSKRPLYLWTENGEVTRYAFPISGYGLWSTVYGYMALKDDLATIIGVTFYRHGETPGLGGEVSQPWFTEQFAGKKVWAGGALLPFEVVKGGVPAKYPAGCDHCVDGISAATITSNGVTDFIRDDLKHYDRYFRTLRGS